MKNTLREFFLANGYTISKPGKYYGSSVVRRERDNTYRIDISDNQLARPFLDAFDTMMIVSTRNYRDAEKYHDIEKKRIDQEVFGYISEFGY